MEDDEYKIDISTISSTNSIYTYTASDTITISNISADWMTMDNDNITLDWDNITITSTVWEDTFPDIGNVKEMFDEYPALEKAYENFKTIYKMVEQDWVGKQKEDE